MSEQSKQGKKKVNWGGMLSGAIMMITCGVIGFFGARIIDSHLSDGNPLINMLIMLGGIYLAFFTQIILHEAGHLIFGLATGYRFVSFMAFGIIWTKGADGKLRAGRMQLAGAGGQCLMAPPDYHDGDYPFTLYNLGGVLMNLITAGIFALLARLIPVTWLQLLLLGQVCIGVAFALLNGLPIPVEAVQNDGKHLLCIRKDEVARRAFWVQMSLAAASAQGVRLKDMPEDWFAPLPEDKMDNAIVSAVAVLNTSRLMDKLDFEGAEAEIRRLLAREKGILGLYKMTMGCDGAVCELIAGRPGDLTDGLATKENQQLMKAMKAHPAILRTQYAIALLKEKDAAKAEKLLADFEKAAKKHPNPQEIVGERELIAACQAAAKENAL